MLSPPGGAILVLVLVLVIVNVIGMFSGRIIESE
jgi:hypothetical protein